MSRSFRIWALASLAVGSTLWLLWQEGTPAAKPGPGLPAAKAESMTLASAAAPFPARPQPAASSARPARLDPRHPHRLANTDLTFQELALSPSTLLLQNALLDTRARAALAIPPHLRAESDSGSFMVQARGNVDAAFRDALTAAQAQIIAYIPNNALLVRGDGATAARLTAHPKVQAVVPFEPYFKLDESLLPLAIQGEALPENTVLNVLFFADAVAAADQALTQMGAQVLLAQSSPFGPQATLRVPPDQLAALARLPAVQAIEIARPRKAANDLARVTIGVAADSITPVNNLNLTGIGVTVGVNDSGVDDTHPGLAGRVTGATTDFSGHGTHVAGSIAGNGNGSLPSTPPPGSTNGASFRGMAPQARIFSQYALYNYQDDVTMQQATAATNILISNNSWNYPAAFGYTFAAASFDAATRDALPGKPGEQPVLFVFSAGNEGGGSASGLGGSPGSILAPATAKNVLTVGSVEQRRFITNTVIYNDQTNRAFYGSTDSSVEVASTSSRGNVGLGQEGDFGRFKPDVVAPGEFVISARARSFTSPTNASGQNVSMFYNVTIPAGSTNQFSAGVPTGAQRVGITIVPSVSSPNPMPALPIFISTQTNTTAADYAGVSRATVALNGTETQVFYAIGNPTLYPVTFDLEVVTGTTINVGNYLNVLKGLNDALGDDYRYESSTSMAAAMVSGLLALLQQHFEQNLHLTNSPALMKALVINGARSLPDYDFNTKSYLTHQGWGLVNLTNSVPTNLAGIFDQSTNRVLATGDAHTYSGITAGLAPLRVTLVWTDPPGNPVASLKLVNDLDLIVSNNVTRQVYLGNNFEQDSDFTSPIVATNVAGSNLLAAVTNDFVNNVENVYIREPAGGSFTVYVRGRRVNVNAVTAHTNSIGQDYALVISGASGATAPTLTANPSPIVVGITNGQALMRQRVGANSALLVSTNGVTNQWNFYVFTNAPSGSTNNVGTNLAFITFIPPNLARARATDADLDLYVSKDATLTNLNPTAIASAWKSLKRGGNEAIAFTNAVVGAGEVYYLGVKSEDQQGAEFAMFASSSDTPFSQQDEDGNVIVNGLNANVEVPDGMPDDPQAGVVFAIAMQPVTIRRVVVTNTITHENLGDLIGILSHQGDGGEEFAVLNNHTFGDDLVAPQPPVPQYTFIYDDSQEGDIAGSRTTQGPGSLADFVGEEGMGVWMLTMVDNALHHTGMVNSLTLRLEPSIEITNQLGWNYSDFYVAPDSMVPDNIRVPLGVTNLSISVFTLKGANLPLNVYVRRDLPPTLTQYDLTFSVGPNGGTNDFSIYDSPPLTPGLWHVGVYNPNTVGVEVRLGLLLGRNLNASPFQMFVPGGSLDIVDDTVTNSYVYVPDNREIADVMVDVRMDHPRAADLVMHLVSPSGTRILLAENRGWASATNYGSGYLTTNFLAAQQAYATPDPITNNITITQALGTLRIDYDFLTIPDDLRVYYEGKLIYQSGFINGQGTVYVDFGPGTGTNLTVIMNEIGGNAGTAWSYTPIVMSGRIYYVTFTENTNLTQTPMKFQSAQFDAGQIIGTNGFPATNRLFVLPEESLNKLIGEVSQGFWQLEVWDSLAGNIVPPMELMTWRLNLAFVNTNANANTLTNGLAVTNTLVGGQTVYFTVEMPISAHFATNVLATVTGGGSLDLLFNQIGIPDTNTPGTVTLLNNVTGGTFILDGLGFSSPQVIPGLRYYLGVRNNTPGTTNTFTLQVNFDIQALNPNGSPVTQTILPGELTYFEVTLPSNAVTATFEVLNLTGDVDLFASRAPGVPTPANFQYGSATPGTNDEQITLTNVNVTGKWNLGVYNGGTSNVTYQIKVSYAAGSASAALHLLGFSSAPRLIANGVNLAYESTPGSAYTLESSTNLVNWQSVMNIVARRVQLQTVTLTPGVTADYYQNEIDLGVNWQQPGGQARFYRLRPVLR